MPRGQKRINKGKMYVWQFKDGGKKLYYTQQRGEQKKKVFHPILYHCGSENAQYHHTNIGE